MQKTVLVTGGAGYIGSACVDALIKEGHKVVVFDDLSTGQAYKISSEAEFIEGSILDSDLLNQICAKEAFDSVIHFAAKKAVEVSEKNPALYFDVNVVGTLNLLKAMKQSGLPKIIFSSSASVYEPPKDTSPVSEVSPIGPVSVYGLTKLMVERIIGDFSRTKMIKNNISLRYFNVGGDAGLRFQEKDPQNVLPIIANKIKENNPFLIYGTDYETRDGTCVRDYIHLKDLVRAHILALNSDENGVFNLGTGTGYSVRELIDSFRRNSNKELMVEESGRRLGDVAMIVADATLAKEKLGWTPEYSLDDIVSDTLKTYFDDI